MLRILVLIISMFVSASSFAAAPRFVASAGVVKGFHEWKNEKIQIATAQIAVTRGQITRAQAENNKKSVEALEKQLDQVKWNIEVARDLSVTDYFVLYLSQINQADRFTLAAQKLSTKEVAELMEAYANTLNSSAPSEVVVRPSAQPAYPSKLPVQAIQARDQFK